MTPFCPSSPRRRVRHLFRWATLHAVPALRRVFAALALASLSAPGLSAHGLAYDVRGFRDDANLGSHLEFLAARDHDIQDIGVQPNGEWVVVSDWGVANSPGFSAKARAKIQEFVAAGWVVDAIAFSPDNLGWVVVGDQSHAFGGVVPERADLEQLLAEEQENGHRVKDLSFDPDGWVLISTSGNAHFRKIGDNLYESLLDLETTLRTPCQACISHTGEWVMIADDWYASRGLPEYAVNGLRSFQTLEFRMDRVALYGDDSYILYAHRSYTPPAEFLGTMEYGLDPRDNLWELMESSDIPGLSVAYIEGNQVQWARGYGELEFGTQRALLTRDLMDLASCSKVLGALTILKLIEDSGGQLHLDSNAQGVRLAGPKGSGLDIWLSIALQDIGSEMDRTFLWAHEYTLRRLLAHSSSLEPRASTRLYPGDLMPNTADKLLGWSTGNTYRLSRRVRFNPDIDGDGRPDAPGQVYRYSGGGYMVAEAMAEVVSGQDFRDLMQVQLFDALGLGSITPYQPLSAQYEDITAVPHVGLVPREASERPIYTWTAAGGVFGAPKDLAEIVIMIMNFGLSADGSKQVLHPNSIIDLLTDQAAGEKNYGLGLNISDSTVSPDNGEFFAHTGSHPGAKSRLCGRPSSGEGLVVCVNAGHDEAAQLRELIYQAFKDYHAW